MGSDAKDKKWAKAVLQIPIVGPDGKATPAGAASWDMGKSVDEGWLTRV